MPRWNRLTLNRLALYAAMSIMAWGTAACHQPKGERMRLDSAAPAPTAELEAPIEEPVAPVISVAPEDRQRGVSWVAQGVVTAENLEALKAVGANWIVQTPFGWQERADSPSLRLATSKVLWGETDAGIRLTTALARAEGIRTLLKPHIWLTRGDGKWRSDIAMADERAWQAWFSSYETFILHYARLAEELEIDALAVGTELRETVRQRPEDWRRIIRSVRAVYGGRLTYAANWYLEFEEVSFWRDLDFIGVQGYFPLTDQERPTVEELRAGWQAPLGQLRAVQRKAQLPVVFTEVGYKSMAGAAIEPWQWPRREDQGRIPVDLETQKRCYEAFFQAVWQEPWVAGAYFWKWFPHDDTVGGADDFGFTPQNKPAEEVLARWYRL